MKTRSGNTSNGKRSKKSKSKRCKESCSTKNVQYARAFQAHYSKATAFGGGSLLVRSSVKKEGVGWSALFPGYTEPVTFCGFLIRARLNQDQIYPPFLLYYLRQSSIREWFASTAGQVAITNISQEKLRDISIPAPSISTQREISSRLEVKTRATYQAVAAVQSQLAAINALPAAYLHRAFRGEL